MRRFARGNEVINVILEKNILGHVSDVLEYSEHDGGEKTLGKAYIIKYENGTDAMFSDEAIDITHVDISELAEEDMFKYLLSNNVEELREAAYGSKETDN